MFAWQFALMQAAAEKNGWTKVCFPYHLHLQHTNHLSQFISMQNHYSLLYREEEREMNALCTHTGVGLIPWGPLNAGRLSRPASAHNSTSRSESQGALSAVDQEIISRVEKLAEKKGWTMSQVALSWIGGKVSSPIVGFSSEKRIEEAIGVRGKELTEEEGRALEEPYVPRAIEGHS